MIAAAIAQQTKNLQFLTTIYVLPMRDSFNAAKAISTAAYLSNNRIIMGVGIGWQKTEFELTGHDFHTRGKRTDEQLDVMRKLMSGEMVEHHGEFHDFAPLQMSPGVTQPVPVLLAAIVMLHLSALHSTTAGWVCVTQKNSCRRYCKKFTPHERRQAHCINRLMCGQRYCSRKTAPLSAWQRWA